MRKRTTASVIQDQPERTALLAEGKRWVRVEAPIPWKPSVIGDVLVGELFGATERKGVSEGSTYWVYTFKTDAGFRTISGAVIHSLLEAVGSRPPEALFRVVYLGERVSGANRTYKDYELYAALSEKTS